MWQDMSHLQKMAQDFLQTQLHTEGKNAQISVLLPDSRIKLAHCEKFNLPTLAPGRLLQKKTVVSLSCAQPVSWRIYLHANIEITQSYLVAARSLRAGQAISSEDVLLQKGEISNNYLPLASELKQVLGHTLVMGLAIGVPISLNALRRPQVIRAGQFVRLVAIGKGFRIEAEGKALSSAVYGQRVQIKTEGGQIIMGVAQESGEVEVVYGSSLNSTTIQE